MIKFVSKYKIRALIRFYLVDEIMRVKQLESCLKYQNYIGIFIRLQPDAFST
jgi:hypothetical protein